jgi:hypothetical protein
VIPLEWLFSQSTQGKSKLFSIVTNIEESKDVPNQATGDHQPRINRPTDDPTKRVPSRLIEPIPECMKALFGQDF